MNILISGINGYIGSKLCTQLLAEGHLVHGLVRQKNTISDRLGVNVFEADIRQPIEIKSSITYDFFVHLAAANDVDSANTRSAYEVTTLGTYNCLKFCAQHNISNFIYFSTFQVYGDVSGNFNEAREKKPVNDYGITHLFAEEYVKLFRRKAGINYLVLRPTNIYGAPLFADIDRWSLVPGCFCKEVADKQSITLLSSGLQERDFVDLEDLVKYTATAIVNFETVKNSDVNVSSGNVYSILEIARETKRLGELLLKQQVDLQIKNNEPKAATPFSIDRRQLSKLGYKFGERNLLSQAIEQTFQLLVKQHA